VQTNTQRAHNPNAHQHKNPHMYTCKYSPQLPTWLYSSCAGWLQVLQYTEEASLAVCDGAQWVGRGEEGGGV